MDTYYPPSLVYENVRKMLTRRGCALVDPALTEADVIKKMVSPEYIVVRGLRAENDQRGAAEVNAVIIAPDSAALKKIAQLKRAVAAAAVTTRQIPLEILLITPELLADRLLKKEELLEKHDNVSVYNYVYGIFITDITEHVSAPKHELVPEDEVVAFCKRYYTTREKFSKISSSDPQAVWLGLRPGMVVRIHRVSETAGTAPAFRVCVR